MILFAFLSFNLLRISLRDVLLNSNLSFPLISIVRKADKMRIVDIAINLMFPKRVLSSGMYTGA